MSLTLYLLRHGETTFSQTGGYCGSLDPDLTESGAEMAGEFAAKYRDTAWEAVYVSPMRRTRQTAAPLCREMGREPQIRDGLREISYGEWEGRTAEDVRANDRETYVRWMTEPAWNAPPGGETALQIESRASPVVSEIIAAHHSGNVLIVSHKATIRILLCGFLGIDLGRYRDRISALAGSISVVEFGDYGPRLELLNDRAYMSDALKARAGS
jgi:broad specificity phosphatase PhoE